MTRIIALANQKGGVGKTTTTLNLGAALAERGHRVLLVDLDPQSNLTICLGLKPYEQEHTTYQVLLNPKAGLAFAIQPVRERLDLVPATLEMAAAEIELASRVGRETLLRRAVASVRNNYDYILLDPPPSLGLFTLNALASATEVLIPLQVEYLAYQAIAQLQQTIELMQEEINPSLEIGGVLCTMVDSRKRLDTTIENRIRKLFGDRVYQTVIPDNVKLAEATMLGIPVMEHDASSAGAQAYGALAEEVESGTQT
jgi:chromosome partitioning protein